MGQHSEAARGMDRIDGVDGAAVLGELRRNIIKKAQDVAEIRGDLNAGDQQEVRRDLYAGQIRERIMVADRHAVQSGGPGTIDDLRRGQPPVVGRIRMYMQIQGQYHLARSFPYL